MKSLFIVGADSPLGQGVRAVLPKDTNVITDSCAFGLSEALQRGQLIDQMRRFGPFDLILFCLDINVQREVNYAVDLIPDVLSKPWLASSVLRELYPQTLPVDLVAATSRFDPEAMWGPDLLEYESESLATILDIAVKRLRASISPHVDLRLHESEGLESTQDLLLSLLRET